MQTVETTSALATDTMNGLSTSPKTLSSKYFYDEKGSKIFQQIMRMPEYYLTDCEFEILKTKSFDIVQQFAKESRKLELIELGAGDGIKTKLLIKELIKQKIDFRYLPIDISEEILINLESNFRKEFSGLEIEAQTGDYFDMMEEIEKLSSTPKIILFLGSNIGNFSFSESVDFLKHLRSIIRHYDKLFIGFDLKKDPKIVLNAYNDRTGHTRDFNLNLLERLNNELGANFELDKFIHSPYYDPENGVAKSFIVSTEEQDVYVSEFDQTFKFKQWEAIYTEMSQKYDPLMIEELAAAAGFTVERNFTDSREYFINSLWKPKQNIQ